MGYVLQGVTDGVGKIVHGIDTPIITCLMVPGVLDAVNNRVTHIHISGTHINFGPECIAAILELTGPHALEKIQAFFPGPVAPGAFDTGGGQGPS